MLDPESDFFHRVTGIVAGGDFTGPNRPVGRVTFSDAFNNRYGSTTRQGWFRSNLFGQGEWVGPNGETRGGGPAWEATELQVDTLAVSRALDQDAATCTVVLPNVKPGAYGPQGDDTDPFGFGYLSSMRGVTPGETGDPSVFGEPTDWGYTRNTLSQLLRTNYLVRTYQGYGSDNFDVNNEHRSPDDALYVHPHHDSRIVLTGVWLIDKVTRSASPGQIPTVTLECRDLAKLLVTQTIYPTLIPKKRFPLVYRPAAKTHGDALSNPNASSSLSGHSPSKALDELTSTWWQSGVRDEAGDIEWLQAESAGSINRVSFSLRGSGDSTVYVSIRENGLWRGDTPIPNGSIPYVARKLNTQGATIELDRGYNADQIRLTFTLLGTVDGKRYTVAVESFAAFTVDDDKALDYAAIDDWSTAIKELCAWAGFTWWDAPQADEVCGVDEVSGNNLAVWGDFERMGAGPVEDTPSDYFVAKSFMDGIRQIVDFLGAIFYIDHTGGVQYRMPNVWAAGSYLADPDSPRKTARIADHPIEFHEDVNLMNFSVVEDDAIMRHEILVVGDLDDSSAKPVAGGISLIAPDMPVSFRGLLNGQKRLLQVPGDATRLFKTAEECQRMAEMIGVKLLFAYRRATSTILAHPGLHLDDQVRIFERTSGEAFVHYVTGITSTMDLTSGAWTMDVTSNWLGQDPETDWFVDTRQLTNAVLDLYAIRRAMGRE